MSLIDPLPPQLPIGPYLPPFEPMNNVTPLTYRDGKTYLHQLELLGVYVNETLVNFINQNFTELGATFTAEVTALIQSVNAHIDEQTAAVNGALAAAEADVTEQLDTQNTFVATSISDLTTYVNEQVQAIITASIVVSDPVVYGIVNDPATQSRGWFDGRYQTPKSVGVEPIAGAQDGEISYTALQNTLNLAAVSGRRVQISGVITTDQTLTINCDCDLHGITYNYTGTGIAVQAFAGAAARVDYKSIVLPTIINTNKTVVGWAQVAGTTGLKLVNINASQIAIPRVENFEIGVEIYGNAAGAAYNDIRLGSIWTCKIGMRFNADATGWANQNTINGGGIRIASAEGTQIAGTRAVMIENTTNKVNTNTFIGVSFEGNGFEYMIDCAGLYNLFLNCRYEASLVGKVMWRATATRNKISEGYGTLLTEVLETGALRNNIERAGTGTNKTVSGTGGVFNLQNDTSAANPVLAVFDSAKSIYDPATVQTTDYDWSLTSQILKGKRAADAFDRVRLSATAGALLMGNGTADPIAGFAGSGATVLLNAATTAVAPTTDGGVDLGTATARFKDVKVRGVLKPGAFTTALRPTGLGVSDNGSLIFDTDLQKLIQWKNPGWVDLAGTAV